MKVYCVLVWWQNEGGDLICVSKTRKRAEIEAARHEEEHRKEDREAHMGTEYLIEEMEVLE